MRKPVRPDILALLLVMACGAGPAGRTPETSAGDRPPAAGARGAEHRVRVARDGTVLADFHGSRASAVLDGKHLSIELASADGVHRLAIEVDGAGPGTYPLAPTFESTKAVILLVSHGVPGRVSPVEGELRLESADGYCGGSFTGQARDANGYRYTFEGSFTAVPIRRL
jgi:hypothetical protein